MWMHTIFEAVRQWAMIPVDKFCPQKSRLSISKSDELVQPTLKKVGYYVEVGHRRRSHEILFSKHRAANLGLVKESGGTCDRHP